MKKGISLITLITTIIIIILLAGTEILNLSSNNPIDNATEAKKQVSIKDINANTAEELVELIPSMKNTDYVNYLAVIEGKLVLKDDVKIPEDNKEIIEEALKGKYAIYTVGQEVSV